MLLGSPTAERLRDEYAGIGCELVAQALPIHQHFPVDEDVHVSAQAPALVTDVERDPRSELVERRDDLGHRGRVHVQRTPREPREQGRQVLRELDLRHPRSIAHSGLTAKGWTKATHDGAGSSPIEHVEGHGARRRTYVRATVLVTMWLRELRVKNLKRLRDFPLSLRGADGEPRRWTVIIGPNGTGKTSILQAVALAAAGSFRADDLVKDIRASLPDKRQERIVPFRAGMKVGSRLRRTQYAEVDISADFVFGPIGRDATDVHPLRTAQDPLGKEEVLRSRLSVSPDRSVAGTSSYVDAAKYPLDVPNEEDPTLARDRNGDRDSDPLVAAREDDLPLWFVAGYGVQRDLPEDALTVSMTKPASIDRLRALFGPRPLIGPNFQALFEKDMALEYADLLRDVLMHTEQLVPGIEHIELRGRGGVARPEDLTNGHRFVQRVAGVDLKLPARWLSHGYQSSLAWVSDLIGQVVLEAGPNVRREQIEGLVLIDEIDLYLHPQWQVGLIQALRETLPSMQFIATTHSPILLSAFHREEVVMLDFDDEGNVVQVPTPRDPRLLTGSELYELFFGIDKLYPAELGERLERYVRIATDPYRSDDEEATAKRLLEELRREDIEPGVPLSLRRQRNQVG